MTTENSVGAASDAKMNRPTIDWRQVHCDVRRLQVRIVKATQEGRWGKVGTLQHLLSANRVPRRALESLERVAGKLARRVLRGRGDGNIISLPDD
jgi:retron-type reverse transcriptase